MLLGSRNEPCDATSTTAIEHDDERGGGGDAQPVPHAVLRVHAAAPVATAITLSGVASARENSAAMRPPRTTRMRCAMPSASGRSLDTITIAAPRRCQVNHDPVDLCLGAHVDSARRLVEEKDQRVAEEPFREHHLLLRPA